MTNEQLSVLLRQYAARLRREIGVLESELPDEMKAQGTSILKTSFTYYPCLENLSAFAEEIEQAVELLEKDKATVEASR